MYRIYPYQKEYPAKLLEIYGFPKDLYCEGNIKLLSKRLITIVGTRKMDRYGKAVLNELFRDFPKDLDVAFVSGLAKGIDVEVHKICLEKGLSTIAVVAGGIDVGFPKCNTKEYEQICKEGLVLAEFSKGTKIGKGMFPIRNRILAGISDTTIVIEAGLKSGSLLTANLALEYGREVFGVPGDIGREVSKGCNELVKQGANAIACREDFLNILYIYQGQLNIGI